MLFRSNILREGNEEDLKGQCILEQGRIERADDSEQISRVHITWDFEDQEEEFRFYSCYSVMLLKNCKYGISRPNLLFF